MHDTCLNLLALTAGKFINNAVQSSTMNGKTGLLFIGLGINDEMDVTLKGLEKARSCDTVFSEFYTATLMGSSPERIEAAIGRKVIPLSREDVESGTAILERARNERVALLTAGDPMAATTHADLRLRAVKEGIPTEVVNGVSILVAAPSAIGLQHYKFGRTTTVPFVEEGYFPTSPYEAIVRNFEAGMHTLVLLDIHADEGRFLTADEGMKTLLLMEEKTRGSFFKNHPLICGLGRVGSDVAVIKCGDIMELKEEDFGPPLHCLVVPGPLHYMEKGALKEFAGAPDRLLARY